MGNWLEKKRKTPKRIGEGERLIQGQNKLGGENPPWPPGRSVVEAHGMVGTLARLSRPERVHNWQAGSRQRPAGEEPMEFSGKLSPRKADAVGSLGSLLRKLPEQELGPTSW